MRNLFNHIFRKVRGPASLLLLLWGGTLQVSAATETATRIYDPMGLSCTRIAESDGNAYMHVNWTGLEQTSTPGEPQLPVEYIRFLVPVYTKVTGVTVNAQQTFPRNTDVQVYPAQEPVMISYDGPVEFTMPDMAAYSRNYQIRAEYVEDGFIDGCNHIVTVAVYPVGYDPAQGVLTAASSVTVTLEYEPCRASELTSAPIFPPARSPYLDLESMVVNPERTASRSYAPRIVADADNQEYYYIITPRNLKEAFNDLAAWKRQKGYAVKVECIEDICANSKYAIGASYALKDSTLVTVLDSAMSLKCYLRDESDEHGHFFCLLAGDWRTPMPIRKVTKSNDRNITDNCEEAIPTDVYFVNLTDNFELVKRKYMTKYSLERDSVKFTYSISVGRLLCATLQEVENYTTKLILYEGNPGYGDNDYLGDALFFEGCSIKESNDKYHIPGSCFIGSSKEVRSECDFFDKIILYQDQYHFSKWGKTYGKDPNAKVPKDSCGPTGDEILREINKVGFSSWNGHGTPYGIMTGAYGYIMYSNDALIGKHPYSNQNTFIPTLHSGLNNLSNDHKPSVVYSNSCENAPFDVLTWDEGEANEFRFDKVNLGRAFTTEGLYGGPAALMYTRGVMIVNGNSMQENFIKQLKIYPKLGLALINTYKDFRKGSADGMKLNLIGEPEFEMWLGKPQSLNVSVESMSSGCSVTGAVPDSTLYILSDGKTSSEKKRFESSQVVNPYSGEYCFSLWKTGYLPIVTLFGQKGSLSEAKRYIVRDAVLGNASSDASAGISYSVAAGGNLSVHALDKISTYDGFTIQNGGCVEFECDQDVELNGGIVKSGGKLVVKAKNIRMAQGFKVEKGGILQIENN